MRPATGDQPIPSPRRRACRLALAAAVGALAAAGALAGCSSPSAPATTTTAVTSSCTGPFPATPVATRVAGSTTDWNVASFDGTVLRAHWFPVATYQPSAGDGPRPTVLMGPGWSLAGDTDVTGQGILGGSPIKSLLGAGFNVLTWDPRGFGRSGGRAEVDSPAYEARDVSALISWVATLSGVQLDRTGDPRMGMVGGSYGGGIQFVTAATDCRVDAIVPTIAWHSLTTSLDKSGTLKSGWAGILTNLSTSDHVDPVVLGSYHTGAVTGTITAAQLAFFASRGPAPVLGRVRIPTLVIQGTVDTLFTLQEGVDNYEALRADGVTTSMRWFCGGHGVCLTPTGDQGAVEQATLAWLRRYVERDTSVATGPGFSFVDQNGTAYAAPAYPLPEGAPFVATGSGTLPLVPTGGSGPVTSVPPGQELASLVAPITPAPAANAVDVPVRFGRAGVVVGAPRLTLTYSGSAPTGTRPTRIFAQLVDRATGLVLGNQVTPVAVTLDGATHTTTVPLEIVAYTAEPTSDVELQLVATTVSYEVPRMGGSVHISSVRVALPVAASLTPVTVPATAGAAG